MAYQKQLRPKFLVLLHPDPRAPEVAASVRQIIALLKSEKLEDAIVEAQDLGIHGEVCRVEATL